MEGNYDVAIVGAGLGGLLCAVFLAKEGKKVILIEQNKQLGGCLQTFSFQKKIFDSCVHYIGAIDEGQTQNKIFHYAGIMAKLQLERLPENGFDKITFGDNPVEYPQAQGTQNFIEQLSVKFPGERNNLQEYINLLQHTAEHFPLYNLRLGDETLKNKILPLEVNRTLEHVTSNPLLKNVLTGNNLLYAGRSGHTPFYIHALVLKSYIDSAVKFTSGSSQITKLLLQQFRDHGGEVVKNEKVEKLISNDGKIQKLITKPGREIMAKQFIANIHPQSLLQLFDKPLFKPAYTKRIFAVQNTVSAFMVCVILKEKQVTYPHSNSYWHAHQDAFSGIEYAHDSWPQCYALYYNKDPKSPEYAESVSILTYMRTEEFQSWFPSFNSSAYPEGRPDPYEDFKNKKTEILLQTVSRRFPEIKKNIVAIKTATPLTFRDYLGTDDGSMYGIEKDVQNAIQTQIHVASKIPNLFFTGQNAGIHGVLGVSITAIATCGAMIGLPYLVNKINKTH